MSSQYYKNLLRNAKGDLADYKKRKSQLEAIKNAYYGFENYATSLNDNCNALRTNMNIGIKLSGGKNDPTSVIGKSDAGAADINLFSSKDYINTEIRRVQGKIEELESDISSYKRSIEAEEQKEKEEAAAN